MKGFFRQKFYKAVFWFATKVSDYAPSTVMIDEPLGTNNVSRIVANLCIGRIYSNLTCKTCLFVNKCQ